MSLVSALVSGCAAEEAAIGGDNQEANAAPELQCLPTLAFVAAGLSTRSDGTSLTGDDANGSGELVYSMVQPNSDSRYVVTVKKRGCGLKTIAKATTPSPPGKKVNLAGVENDTALLDKIQIARGSVDCVKVLKGVSAAFFTSFETPRINSISVSNENPQGGDTFKVNGLVSMPEVNGPRAPFAVAASITLDQSCKLASATVK